MGRTIFQSLGSASARTDLGRGVNIEFKRSFRKDNGTDITSLDDDIVATLETVRFTTSSFR
jgi:hypothetical protein